MIAEMTRIEELAESIALSVGGDPVTDLDAILRSEGLTISSNDYGPGFDGMLEYADRHFHIYCNLHRSNTIDSGRARFTIGHEFGHFFIDEHRRGLMAGTFPKHASRSEFQSRNRLEAEADHFASALLMPRSLFKKHARKIALGIDGVLKLTRLFKTSLAATAIRFVQTSDVACAIARWPATGNPWMAVSPSLYAAGAKFLAADRGSLAADSATALALAKPYGHCEVKGTVATAWFRKTGPFVWSESIMIEEAVSLGSAGAITFLHPLPGSA